MAIDFGNPQQSQNFNTGILQSIRDHQLALSAWLDPSFAGMGYTGLVAGVKRFNTSNGLFETWSGSAWGTLSVAYPTAAVVAAAYAPLASPNFSGTPLIAGNAIWHQGNLGFGATDTYGSLALGGSTGGYAGLQFTAGARKYTFMVEPTAGSSGLYSKTDSAWKWQFDSSGVLVNGTIPWTSVASRPTAVSFFTNDSAYITASALTPYAPTNNPTFTNVVAVGGTISFSATSGAISTTGAIAASGGITSISGDVYAGLLLRGGGGTLGIGLITVTTTTGTPSGGSNGDITMVY